MEKLVGCNSVVDKHTGEIVDAHVVLSDDNDKDTGFHKLWLGHLLRVANILGTGKRNVMWFMLKSMGRDNLVKLTLDKITKGAQVSRPTACTALEQMRSAGFIKTVKRSTYRINPDIIFNGTRDRRIGILMKFRKGEL